MTDTIYPTFFYKNDHIWLDDGAVQWQTHFKVHHMKGFRQRRRIWFESVIEGNRDKDYVIISTIILRDNLYHADPKI